MQQLAVALSKEHAQIQDFRNVKQEVVVDDFSKHGWGEEALLKETERQTFHVPSETEAIRVFTGLPVSNLGFFVRGHPEESQEDGSVDGALHISHRRGGGESGEVEAPGSVMEVRVKALLQGLVKHHLVRRVKV